MSCVAVRHHHDHRLDLTRGEQVVHDDVRPAHGVPRVLIAAAPVQQIQHRVAGRAGVITGRRVNQHPAGFLFQDRGRIPDRFHLAVRDVFEIPHRRRRTGDHEQVFVPVAIPLCLRVAGVEHFDSIHRERVTPQLLGERADRHGPDSRSVFGQRNIRAVFPVAGDHHFAGLGRE